MRIGLDIGSTTLKLIVLDSQNGLVFAKYKRHYSRIAEKLLELLDELNKDEMRNKEEEIILEDLIEIIIEKMYQVLLLNVIMQELLFVWLLEITSILPLLFQKM